MGEARPLICPTAQVSFWRQQGEARDRLEASRDIRVWGQVILPVWPAHARRDWQVKIFARPFGGAGAGRGLVTGFQCTWSTAGGERRH